MFKKIVLHWLILMSFATFCFAQNNSDNTGLFLGEMAEGKYRNDFFGFSLSALPEMFVLSEEGRDGLKKAGVEMFSKDLEKGKAAYIKAAEQEILLFSLLANRPGNNGVSSLNIGVVKQPDWVTAELVCEDAAEFFVKHPHYKLVSQTKLLKRAGKDFARIELSFTNGETKLSLRYYAIVLKGYSITYVITHLSNSDLDKFEKVLDSLEFF